MNRSKRRWTPTSFNPASPPLATLTLMGLNLIAFAMEWQQGGIKSLEILQRLGALDVIAIQQGEWWRIITANFLHYGFAHLGLNLLGLFFIGSIVERYLGANRFLCLYLGSGCGSMALMAGFLLLTHNSLQMVVGASAAVMGCFGGLGIIYYQAWLRSGSTIARNRLSLFGAIAMFQFILDLQMPEVSVISHLLGFICGLALGGLLTRSQHPGA